MKVGCGEEGKRGKPVSPSLSLRDVGGEAREGRGIKRRRGLRVYGYGYGYGNRRVFVKIIVAVTNFHNSVAYYHRRHCRYDYCSTILFLATLSMQSSDVEIDQPPHHVDPALVVVN